MISRFQLKFGRAPGLAVQPIDATPVTVFVGPNNSGKSKVLTEIHGNCTSGQKLTTDVILAELTFAGLDAKAAENAIDRLKLVPNPGEAVPLNHIIVGARGERQILPLKELSQFVGDPVTNVSAFCQWFLRHRTVILNGQSRIGLVNSQPGGDLQRDPLSSLQVLFRDNQKRREVRRILSEAFDLFFVIDPTNLGQLRIRLSSKAPKDEMEERGLHQEAVEFHAKAEPIDQASDGVKAFTGIITELIAGDPRVLLIDEPEAFLHPSLAFKLGYEVSRAALRSDKRVFVSTHSPNFVMGCVTSGAPVNVIRLTYRGGIPTARLLPSTEILALMRNPLLRSTGVLSGLFYEFVIVTESDADRAFYQEINERLLRFKTEWGIPNCLFINAQNKQTVQTIIRPLRKLGIPAAGIVDIDVVKEGGTVWAALLESAHVPAMSHQSLAVLRKAVKDRFESTGKDMKREGGVNILSGEDQAAARNLLAQLGDYGIFVVATGEVESWLKPLGATGHGPPWLIDMFEKMGEDPDCAEYVMPSSDDVWEFVSQVRAWLVAPNRKGIPN